MSAASARLLTLALGDGRQVVSDQPSAKVLRASDRMSRALVRGLKPAAGDASLVWRWLEEQERKHGGVEG